MPPDKETLRGNMWGEALWIALITLCITIGYTYVRYVIVRHTNMAQWPLFLGNKAIALSATMLIALSFIIGPLSRLFSNAARWTPLRKPLGILGFALAALHSMMSLAILSPAYYGKFYVEGGKMNLIGESSLLFGIFAFLIFSIVAVTSMPSIENSLGGRAWIRIQRLGYLAFFFVLLHVMVMGFKGWFDPASWQYGLISISLIAALIIIFVLLLRILVMLFPRK
jgi:methionine sulfoxide reductase heme-binding subunit